MQQGQALPADSECFSAVLEQAMKGCGTHQEVVGRSFKAEAAGPIALFEILTQPAKPFAQFLAVLGRSKPLELHIDRVQGVVFSWLTNRRVDDLLARLLALGAELSGQIDVLESSPATHIEAENVLKVVSLLDQFSIMSVKAGRPSDVNPIVRGQRTLG